MASLTGKYQTVTMAAPIAMSPRLAIAISCEKKKEKNRMTTRKSL